MAFKLYGGALLILLLNSCCSADNLCDEHSTCVALRECRPKTSSSIVYPCHSGLNLICCPKSGVVSEVQTLENRKASLFPINCGVISNENKITGGKNASLGQFPWMSLLGYSHKTINLTEFLCGGTIITQRYVMSAAHCLSVDPRRELVSVRFGELDLQKDIDCERLGRVEICADKYLDIPVEKSIAHPQYSRKTLKNDIALIRTTRDIPTTEWIKPICLPFERNLEAADLVGQRFTISGWGKTNSKNLRGSPKLQYAFVTVWEQEKCNDNLPEEVRNISSSQLCAIGKVEDACKGDSGGPLSNSTMDLNGELRVFQVGIVSFAPTVTCGLEELPPVYTRVDKYLQWITETIVE